MCTHRIHSLKSVSGPCSIEKVYPREWRIAIPASLMRVEKQFFIDFYYLFGIFSKCLAPSGAKYCGKGSRSVCMHGFGPPGGPNPCILLAESEILTKFWPLAQLKIAKTKMAVIQSAASAASARGGCASSQLDHGLKFYGIQGGCASSQLISGFFFAIFGRASGQIDSKKYKKMKT